MGICAEELRIFVIRPTLALLGERGEVARAAENLLLGTAAQESGLGFHLHPCRARGLGIYQITPRLHTNIWDRYLVDCPELASHVRGLASQHEFLAHPHAELTTNLSYATAIAWMVYLRCERPLPEAGDLAGLSRFWLRHYPHGSRGRPEEFVRNYRYCVKGEQESVEAA